MSSAADRPDITPELKVGALLDAYPELETILVGIAPPFAKLSNPLLRRTVAKVTSLRQAASVGGVPVGQLVGTLRKAAGLVAEWSGDEEDATSEAVPRPDWVGDVARTETYDARAMIEAGDMPLPIIMSALESLEPGRIYTFITPFLPTPIIERIEAAGYRIWTERVATDEFRSHCTSGEPH